MRIIDLVREDLILPELHGRDKAAVLAELARHLAARVAAPKTLDPEALLKVLLERERLASTAIGEGVAIPHGKLDPLGAAALPGTGGQAGQAGSTGGILACFGRSREGVDFESMDGRPTYLFFVLVAPSGSTGAHLKALARISRLFKDPGFRAKLMLAKDAAEIHRALADEDAKY